MAKTYKLLPVQVENLKKQYDESLLKLKALNGIKNEEFLDSKAATGNELNLGMDASLLGSLAVTAKGYKEAKEKLENYEIVEPNNSDVIGLGSTFEINMNYDGFEENEIFTLVAVTNANDDESFISIDSPLGERVKGKKAGDKVSYIIEGKKMSGQVIEIIKEHQKTL